METLTYKGVEYPVRYVHQRMRDEDGKVLPNGGKTTARICTVEQVNGEYEETIIASATALCSERDAFNKQMGRTISLGRLKKELGLSR